LKERSKKERENRCELSHTTIVENKGTLDTLSLCIHWGCMQVKAISLAVISHLSAALSCEENVRKRHHEQRKWGKRKERKSII